MSTKPKTPKTTKRKAGAHSLDRLVRCAFTRVEAEHLWNLLWDNKREGSYYGPREQYWKRHDRICDKLHASNWDSYATPDQQRHDCK